jgi:hypothetical protein
VEVEIENIDPEQTFIAGLAELSLKQADRNNNNKYVIVEINPRFQDKPADLRYRLKYRFRSIR